MFVHAGGGRARIGLLKEVSIHAPTQGATQAGNSAASEARCFNPRAHAGRDTGSLNLFCPHFSFNPRAHAGRDAKKLSVAHDQVRFNPRAHAGRDAHRGRA